MKKVSLAKKKFNSLLFAATLTMAVTYLMLLSDTLIVGNIVGEKGISAINIVMPVYSASNFIAGLIGMGTAYSYCRAIGEFQNEKASKLFSQGVFLALVSGVLMFVLMFVIKEPYLEYMNVSDEIRAEVDAYWQYEKFVVLFVPINYLMIEMIYCDGDGLLSITSNAIMVVGNIAQSVFLCLKLGTSGASLGTAIGMFLATATLCLHFFRKSNTLHFKWHFSIKDIVEMNRLALTDAVTYMCWSVLGIILNKLVISGYGESYLVVLTVVMGVFEFSLVFDGIGEAVSPLGEVYLGEKNYNSQKDLLGHALKVCIAEGVAVMVILLVAAPLVPKMFDITNADLLDECVAAVRILAFVMPFSAVAYLLTSQYLLVRKIALSVAFTVAQALLFDALFALLFSHFFGINGIWVGLVIAPPVAIAVVLLYIRLRYGKKKIPWLLDDNEFPTLNRSFVMTTEEIIATRVAAEKFLIENGVEGKTVKRVMLLIEEFGIATVAENEGKKIIAEYSVTVCKDSVQLTLRDSGKIYNLTSADIDIKDISSYVISSIMSKYEKSVKYLTTISFNRSMLVIPRANGEEGRSETYLPISQKNSGNRG